MGSTWAVPPSPVTLANDQVHVWRLELGISEENAFRLEKLLSVDERARAGRFHFQKDRLTYIAARGALRLILGEYLGRNPAELRFCYSYHGKPSLAGDVGEGQLQFNVSHSKGLGLIAAAYRQIGIDIEWMRPDFDKEGFTRGYLSASEVANLLSLPSELQVEAFFTAWARKEAYIKAHGEGLSIPLDTFDVTLEPGRAAVLLATRPDHEEASRWTLVALDPGPGYAAALAVQGRVNGVCCFQFEIPMN